MVRFLTRFLSLFVCQCFWHFCLSFSPKTKAGGGGFPSLLGMFLFAQPNDEVPDRLPLLSPQVELISRNGVSRCMERQSILTEGRRRRVSLPIGSRMGSGCSSKHRVLHLLLQALLDVILIPEFLLTPSPAIILTMTQSAALLATAITQALVRNDCLLSISWRQTVSRLHSGPWNSSPQVGGRHESNARSGCQQRLHHQFGQRLFRFVPAAPHSGPDSDRNNLTAFRCCCYYFNDYLLTTSSVLVLLPLLPYVFFRNHVPLISFFPLFPLIILCSDSLHGAHQSSPYLLTHFSYTDCFNCRQLSVLFLLPVKKGLYTCLCIN